MTSSLHLTKPALLGLAARLVLAALLACAMLTSARAAELTFSRAYQGGLSGQTFTTTAILNADAGSIRFADGGTQRAFQNTSGTLYYRVGGVLHVERGVLNSRYPNGNVQMNAVAFSGTGGDRLLVLGGAYTAPGSYSGSSNAIVDKLNEYVSATAPDPARSTLRVNGGSAATVSVGQSVTAVAAVSLSSGSPLSGATVTLSASAQGISSATPATAVTDSSGQVTFSIQGTSVGTVTYYAIISANGTTANSGTVSITFTGVRSPAQSSASVPAGTAGVATTVAVQVKDSAGTPVAGAAGALTASIAGTNAGATLTAIIDQGGGNYTFTYAPALPGTDSVEIKLDGTAIGGSPYQSVVAAPTLVITPAPGVLPGGTVGTGYSQALSVTGGTAPYVYAATGLPPGLTIDTASGAVSGTPTTGGNYPVTVSVAAAYGASGTAAYTITIAEQVPVAGAVSATVAADSSGNAVPLALTGGAVSSVAVAGPPSHGTATVSGTAITYTPAPGFSGSDSFTYTATNGSGSSAAATVSITVTAPTLVVAPAPGALPGGTVGVAYSQAVSVTGGTAPYAYAATGLPPGLTLDPSTGLLSGQPTAAGSYAVMATITDVYGALGTAGYTITVTITEQAPVTGAVAMSVAADSSDNAVALVLTGGAASSVAVASAPSHGTATVAGTGITYTPTPGYSGSDSFTYTATNASGTSATAAVSITVTAPTLTVAPASGTLPGGTVGTSYSQALSVTGGAAPYAYAASGLPPGLTIDTSSAVSGTPTAAGTYPVSVTVTDAHGASGTAAYTIVVAAPAPPVAADSTSASVPANTSTEAGQNVAVNLSSLVSGEYEDIRIVSQPQHGRVTISRTLAMHGGGGLFAMAAAATSLLQVPGQVIAVYTPDANYQGSDSFQFAAVGPGGTSAPATVVIEVVGRSPTAQAKSVSTIDGQTVSIELTEQATEGPFKAAQIVSVSPSEQVQAAIAAGGTDTARTFRLDVTPKARFDGTIRVVYTLSNAFGTSEPAMVTVSVARRPDPTGDPVVQAISDAQAETTRRFARAQLSNILQRVEGLHGNCRSSNQLRVATSDGYYPAEEENGKGGARSAADNRDEADNSEDDAGDRHHSEAECSRVAVWTAGTVDISTRDATGDRSKINATTTGVSAGADVRLSDGLTLGLGGGFGRDSSQVAGGDGRVGATAAVVTFYGSMAPVSGFFIDGALSHGWLKFDTRRLDATSSLVTRGKRNGQFTAAALSAGIDRVTGTIQWSVYARGEYLGGELGAYRELGAGMYDLRFDRRDIRSTTGVLGFRTGYGRAVLLGFATATLRGEWQYEMSGGTRQGLDYADVGGASFYSFRTQNWSRQQFILSPGFALITPSDWEIAIDLGVRGADGERAAVTSVKASKRF